MAIWENGNGMILENMIAYAPVGFSGDFTATLTFSLNASSINPVTMLDLFFADGNDAGHIVSTVEFVARNIAGTNPTYEIYELSPEHGMSAGAALPGLYTDDINVMVFKKTGSNWTVTVNGAPVCNANLTSYAASHFYPAPDVTKNSAAELVFKSIHVSYSGTMQDRPQE